MCTREDEDYFHSYEGGSPSLPPTPAWKLELINKKKRSVGSSSFSHFDRPDRPGRNRCPSLISPTKTKDIINFFNKTTDVAAPVLSPKRAFQSAAQRHPVTKGAIISEPKTSNGMLESLPAVPAKDRLFAPPGRPANSDTGQAVLGRPAITHHTRHLSCGSEQARAGRSNKWEQQGSVNRQIQHQDLEEIIGLSTHSLSEDDEDTIGQCEVIWSEPGQAACDRYTATAEHGTVEYVFSQPMGEDKRLFISNGRNEVDNTRVAGVGARLYRGRQANKRNIGRGLSGNGAGDSDGMMGSGGESDSSEEIHYGPGFVSRLKSRYMSVALRGSARGSLGTLRRTASLEDFLEIDKNRDEEEVELRQPHTLVSQFNRHSVPLPTSTSSTSSSAVAAKVQD